MDIIKINGLRVETRIGCHAWEQRLKQRLILDVEYGIELKAKIWHDDIKETINYATIADAISQFASEADSNLIETWGEALVEYLFKSFPIPWIKLCIQKNGVIPNAIGVSFILERRN